MAGKLIKDLPSAKSWVAFNLEQMKELGLDIETAKSRDVSDKVYSLCKVTRPERARGGYVREAAEALKALGAEISEDAKPKDVLQAMQKMIAEGTLKAKK